MSKKKYNNIHIGKQNMSCKGLTIDGSKMADSKQEVYLGDTIDKSGSIRPNIEKRKCKGYGIASTSNTVGFGDQ